MTAILEPLGALTTVFTPPCAITWLITTTKLPSQYPAFPTTAPASCDPPSWAEYVTSRGFEYYSPAICPSGFTVGPSCIVTKPRVGEGFPAIQDGETAAYCVPSGHSCTSDITDYRGGVWGVTRTATTVGATVTVGPAIQIRWRSEDLDILETDPLTEQPKSSVPTAIPEIPTLSTTIQHIFTPSTSLSLNTQTMDTPTTETSSEPETISAPSQTRVPDVNTPSYSTYKPTSSTITTFSTSVSVSVSVSHSPSQTTGSSSISTATKTITAKTMTSSSSPNRTLPTNNGTTSNDGLTDDPPSSAHVLMFYQAAMALTAILLTLLSAWVAYCIIRRYRAYLQNFQTKTVPILIFSARQHLRAVLLFLLRQAALGIALATGTREDEDDRRTTKITTTTTTTTTTTIQRTPDAELGTDGPLTELGGDNQALGTKENPAELPSLTTTSSPLPMPASLFVDERESWIARLSRILTARSTRCGSLASSSSSAATATPPPPPGMV